MTELDKKVLEDTGAIVKEVAKEESFKLLEVDERKEMKRLRELLAHMTTFQIRFIEQYARCGVAGEAARKAGSKAANPESVGYKMMQDPNLQMALAIIMKKRIERGRSGFC